MGIAAVVSLGALAPVAIDPMGAQIQLAPLTVDIETLPGVGEELATRPMVANLFRSATTEVVA